MGQENEKGTVCFERQLIGLFIFYLMDNSCAEIWDCFIGAISFILKVVMFYPGTYCAVRLEQIKSCNMGVLDNLSSRGGSP